MTEVLKRLRHYHIDVFAWMAVLGAKADVSDSQAMIVITNRR
jgi:hypothetical protein